MRPGGGGDGAACAAGAGRGAGVQVYNGFSFLHFRKRGARGAPRETGVRRKCFVTQRVSQSSPHLKVWTPGSNKVQRNEDISDRPLISRLIFEVIKCLMGVDLVGRALTPEGQRIEHRPYFSHFRAKRPVHTNFKGRAIYKTGHTVQVRGGVDRTTRELTIVTLTVDTSCRHVRHNQK